MNVTLNIIGSIGTTGYSYSESESVLEKPTLLSHFSLQSLDGRENEKSYWEYWTDAEYIMKLDMLNSEILYWISTFLFRLTKMSQTKRAWKLRT